MRKSLLIGIDFYSNPNVGDLSGCVNDAHSLKAVIERHADGTVNFATPKLLTGTGPRDRVKKTDLKAAARELFSDDSDIALFYFAGHGYVEDTGGFLCASDCETGDDGFSVAELMTIANSSPARNKIIVLDSCHSGIVGDRPKSSGGFAEVAKGTTILTASTDKQYAAETEGGGAGVFTTLLVDALRGAAANLVGDVTPGSVYAHIDQSLGPWSQRPVFKTNVETFVSLRRADPPIDLTDLQAIATLFPTPDFEFQLDPSFEPERSAANTHSAMTPPPNPANTAVFSTLQKLVKVNLVRPKGAPHMWHAAMNSKSCELTVLGEHYRRLVAEGLL